MLVKSKLKLMLNLRADKPGWRGPAKVEQNEESVYIPRRTTATLPETQEKEDSEVCDPYSVKNTHTHELIVSRLLDLLFI